MRAFPAHDHPRPRRIADQRTGGQHAGDLGQRRAVAVSAIGLLRERDWTPAVDPDGEPCPVIEAAVAELTGLLPARISAAYPAGTRVIVRRERPHPAASST